MVGLIEKINRAQQKTFKIELVYFNENTHLSFEEYDWMPDGCLCVTILLIAFLIRCYYFEFYFFRNRKIPAPVIRSKPPKIQCNVFSPVAGEYFDKVCGIGLGAGCTNVTFFFVTVTCLLVGEAVGEAVICVLLGAGVTDGVGAVVAVGIGLTGTVGVAVGVVDGVVVGVGAGFMVGVGVGFTAGVGDGFVVGEGVGLTVGV